MPPAQRDAALGTGALETGLGVLRLIAEAQAPLTATAIAERLDVHVSTASRILGALATLSAAGMAAAARESAAS